MARRPEPWSAENDRWYFFWFFVVGVIFILTLKGLIDNQVIVTAVPCMLMLAYACLHWDFEDNRPRAHSTGDNLYYLGFLYTLTSLGHSLYRFSTDQEGTEGIITNFGIAISTTILGMALRILLGRTADDELAAMEDSARLNLAQAARELQAEMNYTVQDFKSFREQLGKDFEGFGKKLVRDFDDAQAVASKTLRRSLSLERAIAKFEEGSQTAAAVIVNRMQDLERSVAVLTEFENAVKRLRTGADSVAEAVEQRSDELTAGASRIHESLRSQAERIRAVDFRQAFLDHTVKPASSELRAASAEFSTLLDKLRQADAQRERVLAGNEQAMTRISEALKKSGDLAEAAASAADGSREAAAALQAVGDRVSRFGEDAQDAARQVAGVRDEFSRSVERVRAVNEELTRMTNTLAALARKIETAASASRRRRWFPPWR